MLYVGDYMLGEYVRIPFQTMTAAGVSVTATMSIANVKISSDDSSYVRPSTNGATLYKDFSGIVGTHLLSISTADNTVAEFYIGGSDYFVRLEGITVDGNVQNIFVGMFSIENRPVNVTKVLSDTPVTLADIPSIETVGQNKYVYTTKDDSIDAIKEKTDLLNIESTGSVYTVSDGIIESIYNNTESIKSNVLDILVDTENVVTYAARVDAMIEDVSGDRFTAHALQAAGVGVGAGAYPVTYTVTFKTVSQGVEIAVAVPQCKVWATPDPTGAEIVCSGYTNDFGQITFYLDAGTYYFWSKKSGFDFTNPDTVVVGA